ncbi:MAG: hypothetical protein V8Q84_03305 [Bilophila sp.]
MTGWCARPSFRWTPGVAGRWARPGVVGLLETETVAGPAHGLRESAISPSVVPDAPKSLRNYLRLDAVDPDIWRASPAGVCAVSAADAARFAPALR